MKIRSYAPIFALLGIFFAAMAYGSAGSQEILSADERTWLTQNQPRLVLAVETGYAPFVFIDSKDQPTGLAHDYMRLIESKLGVHFNQKRFSSLDDIFQKARGGEVHIVNAVTSTPDRAKFLSMTPPFISVPNVIIVGKDRSGLISERELSGLKVSLVKSYAVTEHMAAHGLYFVPDIVSDDLTSLLNVSFGRSDAAVIDLATASYLITEKGITNLHVAGEVAYDIRLSIATPLNEPVLYGILQKGLKAITDAERQEIRNRWINVSGSQDIFKERQLWIVLGSVVAVAFAIFAIILVWNRTLRQQIVLRKQVESELREKEERLALATLQNGVGVWDWNLITQEMIWDDSMYSLYHIRREDFIGTEEAWRAALHPDDLGRGDREVNDAIAGIKPFNTEFRVVWPNGEIHYIKAVAKVFRDGRGTPFRMLGINMDITERKEFEEELQRSNVDLEQFAYAVSHDMRQPLRMIASYLQLIEIGLAGQLDGEKRSYLNFAIEGAKRIDQMLMEILEYSRVGKAGEQLAWIDSRATLDEALHFLQPALNESQARLNIVGEWPHIMASHDEILRLLQNLIDNAVKFRVAGRIPEITITGQTVKNEWSLCVADNGVGIIPEQSKRLFQVFQRLHSREAYAGTGIGLALCRKIAEHHKGRIWAESAGEGNGSQFCVVLPVLREKT
ncbi:MAG: transporter substrate-binding domain-containing protein [Sulfuricellaceae bacterium]